jgi:hypothetical protein
MSFGATIILLTVWWCVEHIARPYRALRTLRTRYTASIQALSSSDGSSLAHIYRELGGYIEARATIRPYLSRTPRELREGLGTDNHSASTLTESIHISLFGSQAKSPDHIAHLQSEVIRWIRTH